MFSKKLTATTTAQLVGDGAFGSANVPVQLCLRVPSSATHEVWVGGADVNTSDKGFPVFAGEQYSANLINDDVWFVADASQDFYVNITGPAT